MATFQLVTCYASSSLQENQSFIFKNSLYQVERRLIRIAEEIFRNLVVQKTLPHQKYQTLPTLCVEDFSPKQLNFILYFFKFGQLKESPIDSEMKLNLRLTCFRYHLPLFDHYLNEKLSPEDRLELAAIQQNVKEFFKLIDELFTREKSLSKEILCAVNHFEPEKFEDLMINFICSYSSQLSSSLIQTYFSERQGSVENVLHQFQSESFKFQCMGEISHLNKRYLWFQHFWTKIPVELIRKTLIQPFIDLQCVPQAKEWATKSKDSSSFIFLLNQFKKCFAKSEMSAVHSLQETPSSLHSSSNNNNQSEDVDAVCQDLQTLSLDSSALTFSLIPETIQEAVDNHFSKILSRDVEGVKKRLLQMIESNSATPIEWNVELLLAVMRYYMQKIIYYYSNDVLSDIQKAQVPLRLHEKHLHPALQENYEILYRLLPFIKGILIEEFKNACFSKIIEENPKLFDSHFLIAEMVSIARQLYCQEFSLQEDFVIQSVGQELHPYLVGEAKTTLQPEKPFLQRLEESFKKAGLGDALNSSHVELAISIYIQKGVEAVNFRKFFVQNRKLNIYLVSDNWGNSLREVIPALESALKKDFPLKEVELKAPQMIKFFTKQAELVREVFIKSQQAYYRIMELEKVQYIPYSPKAGKSEIHYSSEDF